MKIIVFGASGRMGKLFVEQALAAGHTVSASFRTPLTHSNLSLIQEDALNPNLVKNALSGQDVVVSALGPSHLYAPEIFVTISDNITTAMQTLGIRRLIFSSGTIMADPQDQPGIVDRLFRFMARQSGREVV
jgi:putative NADH-flavin reductase